MPLSIDSILFDELTSDPAPGDGEKWYNTTDDKARVRQNGETRDFTDNDAISVYDSTGGQSFTTTAITVNLDTTFKNTNTSLFSLASDQITVSTAGTYYIAFQASADAAGSGRNCLRGWIEKNSTEINGTRGFVYTRTSVVGEGTCHGHQTLDLAASDVIRLRMVRHSGGQSQSTIADASRLTIVRVS